MAYTKITDAAELAPLNLQAQQREITASLDNLGKHVDALAENGLSHVLGKSNAGGRFTDMMKAPDPEKLPRDNTGAPDPQAFSGKRGPLPGAEESKALGLPEEAYHHIKLLADDALQLLAARAQAAYEKLPRDARRKVGNTARGGLETVLTPPDPEDPGKEQVKAALRSINRSIGNVEDTARQVRASGRTAEADKLEAFGSAIYTVATAASPQVLDSKGIAKPARGGRNVGEE